MAPSARTLLAAGLERAELAREVAQQVLSEVERHAEQLGPMLRPGSRLTEQCRRDLADAETELRALAKDRVADLEREVALLHDVLPTFVETWQEPARNLGILAVACDGYAAVARLAAAEVVLADRIAGRLSGKRRRGA